MPRSSTSPTTSTACIAGCHEILRRQGLLEGIWCLDPNETLGPGQTAGDRSRLRRLSASQRRRLRARRISRAGWRETAVTALIVSTHGAIAWAAIANAAALRAGGGQPSAAGRGVVSLRRARQGAEVRHAVAVRHAAGAARSELSLAREHHRHRHRDFRRLYPRGRRRHRHRAAVLLVRAGSR